MSEKYGLLSVEPLEAHVTIAQYRSMPELVHFDNPALDVMTDLRAIPAVTVQPDLSIEAALLRMIHVGVRLLLVTNSNNEILGLITAKDIQGETPIKLAEERGLSHADILVEMIMTPQERITVFNIKAVEDAAVGNVVATLKRQARQHGLVVEQDAAGKQLICGIFSTTQISKQLGHDVTESMNSADSLADLVAGS